MSISSALKAKATELKLNKHILAIRQVRKSLADLYPSLRLKWDEGNRSALREEFGRCISVEECMQFTRRHMKTGSCQIRTEITSTLEFLNSKSPKVMCEIGTFDGGTSLLFLKFLPSLETMICIDLHVKNKEMLRLLAPRKLNLKFFDMPSYAKESVRKVSKFLDGRTIDTLFIDGDHRYEGVKQDFISYRTMVKEGSQILFHDIVQEKGSGRAWAGGVPALWRELSPHYQSLEFINDPDQSGFGIGCLTYSIRPATEAAG
jgi:predicted O-methyltransferase YrrM